jgi:hypothetical protein
MHCRALSTVEAIPIALYLRLARRTKHNQVRMHLQRLISPDCRGPSHHTDQPD